MTDRGEGYSGRRIFSQKTSHLNQGLKRTVRNKRTVSKVPSWGRVGDTAGGIALVKAERLFPVTGG